VALKRDRVTESTKAKVLQGMKTGQGITVAMPFVLDFLHQIAEGESHVGDLTCRFPYVKHLDLSEGCHMSHKSIYSRTDVHVHIRVPEMNPSGHEQILMKIVS